MVVQQVDTLSSCSLFLCLQSNKTKISFEPKFFHPYKIGMGRLVAIVIDIKIFGHAKSLSVWKSVIMQ